MKMFVAFMAALFTTHALAHGPTPIKVNETIAIAAKPEAVWAIAGKFGGIGAWHPDVKSVKATGGEGNGAEREISLQGGALKESLDEYNPGDFKLAYRMSDPNLDAMPVSSYSMTMTIKPTSEGSEVSWYGRLYRGDTGNEPPENLNDDAARTAMSKFLSDGLQGLKKAVEKR